MIKNFNENHTKYLSRRLQKFNDFFSETTENIFVNNLEVKEKRKVRKVTFPIEDMFGARFESVNKFEIFDYDLEEIMIENVSWQTAFLGLKSNETEANVLIRFFLEFNEISYKLRITVNLPIKEQNIFLPENETEVFFEEERKYNSSLYQEEFQQLGDSISKKVLQILKLIS